jgi:hypothetical protein
MRAASSRLGHRTHRQALVLTGEDHVGDRAKEEQSVDGQHRAEDDPIGEDGDPLSPPHDEQWRHPERNPRKVLTALQIAQEFQVDGPSEPQKKGDAAPHAAEYAFVKSQARPDSFRAVFTRRSGRGMSFEDDPTGRRPWSANLPITGWWGSIG